MSLRSRANWRRRALVAAVALLVLDVFLFYTLVLNEPYLEKDRDAWTDVGVLLGAPLLAGLACGVVAVGRGRKGWTPRSGR